MALRAGYYGIKRALKAKLAEIAGAWDAFAATVTVLAKVEQDEITTDLGDKIHFIKVGNMVHAYGDFGGTAPESESQVIGTIPEKFRPAVPLYMECVGRTVGAWASADFYPFVLHIVDTNGKIDIKGKISNQCKYFSFSTTWSTVKPAPTRTLQEQTPEVDPEEKEAEEASEPVTKKRTTKKTVKEGE